MAPRVPDLTSTGQDGGAVPEKVVDFGIGTACLALPVNDKMARLTFMSTAEMLRLKDRLTR